jgi:hypothetical protein
MILVCMGHFALTTRPFEVLIISSPLWQVEWSTWNWRLGPNLQITSWLSNLSSKSNWQEVSWKSPLESVMHHASGIMYHALRLIYFWRKTMHNRWDIDEISCIQHRSLSDAVWYDGLRGPSMISDSRGSILKIRCSELSWPYYHLCTVTHPGLPMDSKM